jgi:hypothetical protein
MKKIHGDDTTALQSVLDADIELQSLLQEEKTLQQKMNRMSTTPDEMATINARLKVVYQSLDDLEADKAASK